MIVGGQGRRRKQSGVLLAGAAIIIASPLAAAQTPVAPELPVNPPTAASSQRINTTGKPVDLVVPMRERVPLGQVAIRILPDDKVLVSKADFAAAIGRIGSPALVAAVTAIPAVDGLVSLDALNANGVTVRIDPSQLELVAGLDASGRGDQDIDFGFNKEMPVLPDTSSPFAVFLSYQANLDFEHSGPNKGLRGPRVNFDLGGRVFNRVAFENEFTYDRSGERTFSRFGSRAYYDLPKAMIRIGAGDLASVPIFFQDSTEILGVGVSKLLNEFRPDRVFTATAGQRLTLNENATVTILVNGVAVRSLRLGPGNYNFDELPLVSGANNVELVIEDEAGGRRLIAFNFFQDTILLERGVDEYDAKLGIRSDFIDDKRIYERKVPTFSGFYRRGLTDQLTAGANAQATDKRQQIGVEAALGTSIGLFSTNLSASHNEDGNGIAARVQYQHAIPLADNRGARRLDALVEYRSARYGSIESFNNFNSNAWIFAARASQPFSRKLSASAGVDYRIGREQKDRYSAFANVSYRLRENITLNGTLGYSSIDKMTVGLTVFWRRNRTDSVLAQYDSRFNDASVAYTHSPERLLDTVAWGIGATRSGGQYGINGTATLRTNRGDFELAHRSAIAGSSGSQERTSSVRARGTIAFAGGTLAVGRYLSDSFAIVSAHRSLKGAQVLIGAGIGGTNPQARTGALGPALVPTSSYANQTIYYDVPDAPDGYDFGTANIALYPWLHSGSKAVVGSSANIALFGTLLDDRGTPVALVAGRAVSLSDATLAPVELFTNREGRIGASGLSPGRWRIEADAYTYEIVIDESQGSFVDVKELRPSGKRETGS